MSAQLPRRTLLASTAVAASAPLLAACTDAPAPRPPEDHHDPETSGGDVLVTNALVFDGERFTEHDSVLVREGLIAEVGQNLADDAAIYDCGGRVLLPGLIDAHAHRSGSNASAGLRFGVTAMLDMYGAIHSHTSPRESLDQHRSADVWWAGWGLTVPGGHPTQWFPNAPTVSEASEVDAFVAERAEEGSDFLKILIQQQGPSAALDQDQTTAGVEAAHARGMLAVAHVGGWDDALLAARAGVDALVHLPLGLDPDQEALDLLAERGTPVVATLTVSSSGRCEHDATTFLDDPAIADRLDGLQRREASHKLDFCDTADIGRWRDMTETSFAAVREAGLPLLIGTDNGNPPVVTGVSMYHEMAMFAEQGMSTEDILAGATSTTADVFGLDERGRIAPGKRGDMVLLDATEPEDVIGTYAVEAVWKNGHAVDLKP
jgi:imidazolonepropionase-like amidohydrolase